MSKLATDWVIYNIKIFNYWRIAFILALHVFVCVSCFIVPTFGMQIRFEWLKLFSIVEDEQICAICTVVSDWQRGTHLVLSVITSNSKSFVCSIIGLTNMKTFFFENHLDIHFRDIINKNVISDVLTSYFISDKYVFFENIFDMLQVNSAFPLISRIFTLWVRANQKVSVFFSC